jgi:hypothetical protein
MFETTDTQSNSPTKSNGQPRGTYRGLFTGKTKIKLVPVAANGDPAKPEDRSSQASRSRRKKPYTWGVVSGLIGFIFLLGAIVLELWFHPRPEQFLANLGIQLLGHIGVATLVLGIVGITVEFKNWTEYFEERLAFTIRKKEFLKTLKPEELMALLKDTFLSYYKVETFDSNSFHEFFTTKLQDYIGKPFREELSRIMTVDSPDAGHCRVKVDFSYTCRTIAGEDSKIQKDVTWQIEKTDIVGDPKDYHITLKIPTNRQKSFISPPGFPECKSGKIFFSKEDLERIRNERKERLKKLGIREETEDDDPEKYFCFRLSLESFSDMDGLEIEQHVEYVIPIGRFSAWGMKYPTKGVRAVFNYPEKEFDLLVESFGMDPNNETIVPQPGLYSVTYASWLLPRSGLAYSFMPKKRDARNHWSEPQKSAFTTTVDDVANAFERSVTEI